eukprot:GFYU01014954.1.p1 GENE.GFYU01014954.1~~GFYU01014954.1.p1  ORF type:complete len:390 (-),score=15.11 GFYU01014954.1:38-1186(-)
MADDDRIYVRLCELLAARPSINELGLVVTTDEQQLPADLQSVNEAKFDEFPKQPFLLHGDKLGVAFWATPHIFTSAMRRFKGQRKHKEWLDAPELLSEVQMATSIVVLINAECYSAWNCRKKILSRSNSMTNMKKEIHLLNLVFSKHPKSGEGWAHRRWVAERLLSVETDPSAVAIFLNEELAVCAQSCDIYPKNYFSWSYRHWVCTKLDMENLARELQSMCQWIAMHVSDHAGFHHRQYVVLQMRSMGSVDLDQLLSSEWEFVRDIIARYPGHESPWHYRRFLLAFTVELLGVQYERVMSTIREEVSAVQMAIEDDEIARAENQRLFARRYLAWACMLMPKDRNGNYSELYEHALRASEELRIQGAPCYRSVLVERSPAGN